MNTTFQERAFVGELFASATYVLLRAAPLSMIRLVTRAGVEHSELAACIDDIRRSGNPMERRRRFNPDGEIFTTSLAHWESKASSFIEKDPYEYYLAYEQAGEPVLLFLAPKLFERKKVPVFCGRVRDLVLQHGNEYETQFPQPRPVSTDGWIYPRHDRFGARQSRDGLTGSGTPFRPVDIAKSRMVKVSEVGLRRDAQGRVDCWIQLDMFAATNIAHISRVIQ